MYSKSSIMSAVDTTTTNAGGWTLPKFYFKVDFGEGLGIVSFQEISGLDVESQQIEYRKGNSSLFSTIKMPGITKSGNITLKKGIFVKDNAFLSWYRQIKMNTISKKEITIALLDEQGQPIMTWTLSKAWPVKISSTDLKAEGNEVAVEAVEILHEGVIINNV